MRLGFPTSLKLFHNSAYNLRISKYKIMVISNVTVYVCLSVYIVYKHTYIYHFLIINIRSTNLNHNTCQENNTCAVFYTAVLLQTITYTLSDRRISTCFEWIIWCVPFYELKSHFKLFMTIIEHISM